MAATDILDEKIKIKEEYLALLNDVEQSINEMSHELSAGKGLFVNQYLDGKIAQLLDYTNELKTKYDLLGPEFFRLYSTLKGADDTAKEVKNNLNELKTTIEGDPQDYMGEIADPNLLDLLKKELLGNGAQSLAADIGDENGGFIQAHLKLINTDIRDVVSQNAEISPLIDLLISLIQGISTKTNDLYTDVNVQMSTQGQDLSNHLNELVSLGSDRLRIELEDMKKTDGLIDPLVDDASEVPPKLLVKYQDLQTKKGEFDTEIIKMKKSEGKVEELTKKLDVMQSLRNGLELMIGKIKELKDDVIDSGIRISALLDKVIALDKRIKDAKLAKVDEATQLYKEGYLLKRIWSRLDAMHSELANKSPNSKLFTQVSVIRNLLDTADDTNNQIRESIENVEEFIALLKKILSSLKNGKLYDSALDQLYASEFLFSKDQGGGKDIIDIEKMQAYLNLSDNKIKAARTAMNNEKTNLEKIKQAVTAKQLEHDQLLIAYNSLKNLE